VPAVKPVSHNRFYLSPYYPVFGSRMVMIDDPWHRENACNSLILRSFGDFTGASPASAVGRPSVARLTLAASLDTGVTIDRPACRDTRNDADTFGELVSVTDSADSADSADSKEGTGWASARSSRPGVPAAACSST
jgi:hypothetical protein